MLPLLLEEYAEEFCSCSVSNFIVKDPYQIRIAPTDVSSQAKSLDSLLSAVDLPRRSCLSNFDFEFYIDYTSFKSWDRIKIANFLWILMVL